MNGTILNNKNLHNSQNLALRMENISKSFYGIPALNSVRLEAAKGEVHALMGENGAGKSTLMKILSGIYRKDEGRIYLDGKPVDIRSAKEALQLGIAMIHQELNPVRAMTVSENIYLGKEPCYRFMGVVNQKKQREQTLSLFSEMDISINADAALGDLSVAEIQMVEIAKAMSYDSRIIIMDEPTSAITGKEVAKLFEIILNLKSKGVAIIYISHKMDEIFRIADSITVLRDGRYIETRPSKEFDQNTLVRLMVGRTISELFPKVNSEKGQVTLEVESLTQSGKFQDISFKARKGEVLGFAGLMGAGRSEIMETIFGLQRADTGRIKINGKNVHIQTPADAIRYGIALITDDRQLKGLNLKMSVKDNITLVSLKNITRFNQLLLLDKENRIADEEIKKLRIKAHNKNQAVSTLSGGNQQKVVLAKWLLNNPDIIILDEPTQGIDIGAKAEIYKIISRLAEEGKTIIIVSSELLEIMGMCDRVIVLYHGRISAEFERNDFNQERIINTAMGSVTK
jgi:inositol transport system ATP-binding protein